MFDSSDVFHSGHKQPHSDLNDMTGQVIDKFQPKPTETDCTQGLDINSVALVRERTIPTERPPPVGEVSANFCG